MSRMHSIKITIYFLFHDTFQSTNINCITVHETVAPV